MRLCFCGRPKDWGNGVGPTAERIEDIGRLAEFAARTPGSKRSDAYVAVALLFRAQGEQVPGRERAVMRDILKRLAPNVELTIRVSLAEKLADDPEAPLDLLLLLAGDATDVARPILLRSRRLTDRDILEFLAHADMAHHAVCAERPNIGEAVTDKLAASDAEPILVALARNAAAKIGPAAFERLVDKSFSIVSLQEPLARRKDLPASLASRLYAARSVAAPPEPRNNGHKLVEKLATAGQLKPGFLLRVLQQGQSDLFDLAFAKLLDIDPSSFHEMFYRRGPRPVALACRAVGIDRCVFPTVYTISRRSRSINPVLSQEERFEIDAVFGGFSRQEAKGILRQNPCS